MRRARLVLLLVGCLFIGCSSKFTPEPIHPSLKRIAELARVESPTKHEEAPFALTFYPAITLPGGSTRVTCHVPPSWNAEFVSVHGFEGKIGYITPAYLYEPRVVSGVPCGKNTAKCAVVLPSGEVKTQTRNMEIPCPEDR